MRSNQGFTLIEVLVSIMLLAVIVTVVVGSLGGLFRSSRDSDQRLQTTTQVQTVAEGLRRHWMDPNKDSSGTAQGDYRFSRSCVDTGLYAVPTGVTVTVWDLTAKSDGSFAVSDPYSLSTACPTTAARPANTVRRVRVQSSGAAGTRSELTFEFYRSV